jgi:hypothetical protein
MPEGLAEAHARDTRRMHCTTQSRTQDYVLAAGKFRLWRGEFDVRIVIHLTPPHLRHGITNI